MKQLALPLEFEQNYDAADFLAADSNADAMAWLASADWPQLRLALYGPEGSGKTHLLRIWAERHAADVVAGPALVSAPPDRPLAIDDADAAPERTLLHVLNAAAEAGLPVLLAARTPPARWPVALPDLASRLRAVTAVGIAAAEDTLLQALLARLLAARRLAVAAPLQDYLRLRLPRTPAAIRAAAAGLDRLSLMDGRPATQARARQVLAELGESAEDAPEHDKRAHSSPARF